MDTKDLRVGIIGIGDGGMCNALALRSIPGIAITAVCDTDSERLLEACATLSGARAYGDAARFAADPDIGLVVVATPDHLHLEPTRLALKAGRFVFVEKPLVTTDGDLSAMLGLADQFPGRFFYSEKHSFGRQIQPILANRDALGELRGGVVLYSGPASERIMSEGMWRTSHPYNPFAGGLSHHLLVVRHLVGRRIVRVSATGSIRRWRNLEKHGGFDTMQGVVEFENGVCILAAIDLAVEGANNPYGHRAVAFELSFERGSYRTGSKPEDDQLIVNGTVVPITPEPAASGWREYNIGEMYRLMHEDTLGAIRSARQPLHQLREAFNVTGACIAVFDSAKQGGEWLRVQSGMPRRA